MKAFLALCFILAISSSAAFNPLTVKVNDTTVYSLYKFVASYTTFKNVSFSADNTSANHYITLNVSLAKNVIGCDGQREVYATLVNGQNDTLTPKCYELATQDVNENYTTFDTTDPASGLLLTFPYNNGTVVTDNTTNTTNSTNGTWAHSILAYEFICDKDAGEKTQFDSYRQDRTNGLIIITVRSSNSCPNSYLSKLSFFFTKYKIVFLILFLVLGGFVAFFGLQMLKYTIFIVGMLGGTLISAYLLLSFVHYSSPNYVYWLIFAVCLVIGGVVGYISVKIETLGFIILGAVLGVCGGLMLYTAVLAPAKAGIVWYWVTLVVAGIIGAGLAYKFWKNVVIIATSVLGSFMIIRAIGAATNTFPSEDSIASGVNGFSPAVYGYLVAVIIITIAGVYFQHKKKKEHELEKESAEDVHGYQRVMAYNP